MWFLRVSEYSPLHPSPHQPQICDGCVYECVPGSGTIVSTSGRVLLHLVLGGFLSVSVLYTDSDGRVGGVPSTDVRSSSSVSRPEWARVAPVLLRALPWKEGPQRTVSHPRVPYHRSLRRRDVSPSLFVLKFLKGGGSFSMKVSRNFELLKVSFSSVLFPEASRAR